MIMHYERNIVVLKEDSLLAVGFKDQLLCRVGNGNNTRFWMDPWVNFKPLSIQFSRLFAMSSNKLALILDTRLFVRDKWVWDLSFRRAFFRWELELYTTFLNMINSITPAKYS